MNSYVDILSWDEDIGRTGILMTIYQLRNKIVHEFKDSGLSDWKILSLWDNAMNIIDISVTVFQSASEAKLRSSLDSDYQWGIEREKRRKLYDLYSLKILKYLYQNGQSVLTKEGKLNSHILEESKMEVDDEVLTEYEGYILRRMERTKLIRIIDNTLRLTFKGENRAKKLKS